MKTKLISYILAAILFLANASAFTASGSGNVFDFMITSGNNPNPTSENFGTFLITGDVTGNTTSSDFDTRIGFLITNPFLNGESCKIASECFGGFCCSNVCRSSACPTEAAAAGGGGGGDGGSAGGGCSYNWKCTEWAACHEDNTRARICSNKGTCSGEFGKPEESQSCTYIPEKKEAEEKKEEPKKIPRREEYGEREKAGIASFAHTKLVFGFMMMLLLIGALIISFYAYKEQKEEEGEDILEKFYHLGSLADLYIIDQDIGNAKEAYRRMFQIYTQLIHSKMIDDTKMKVYAAMMSIFRRLENKETFIEYSDWARHYMKYRQRGKNA